MYRPDEMAMILEQAKQYTNSQRLGSSESKSAVLFPRKQVTMQEIGTGVFAYEEEAEIDFEQLLFPLVQNNPDVLTAEIEVGGHVYRTAQFTIDSGAFLAGNFGLVNPEMDDTGEPFFVLYENGVMVFMCKASESAPISCYVGLTVKAEIIHPIPQEYIPPLDRLILNGNDGKQYALTITDGAVSVAPATT